MERKDEHYFRIEVEEEIVEEIVEAGEQNLAVKKMLLWKL
jgi:hypothetical protein